MKYLSRLTLLILVSCCALFLSGCVFQAQVQKPAYKAPATPTPLAACSFSAASKIVAIHKNHPTWSAAQVYHAANVCQSVK